MILLSAQNIDKAFGAQAILKGASLVVQDRQIIGLVGPNGAGKSTLLRILAGESQADSGEIFYKKELRLGYLPQNSVPPQGGTVWSILESVFDPVKEMEGRLRAMEQQMGALHGDEKAFAQLSEQYNALLQRFEQADGYRYPSLIQGVLIGLGFDPERFDQNAATLSGGQLTRLALARVLLQKYELLILDEPTNHLDLAATTWLEDYLKGYGGALLIVSHDRYLLDALCTGIAEMQNGAIRQYEGNYSQYAAKSEALHRQQEKEYEMQQREIARQKAIIERYRQFNREKSIRAAESRERLLNRIELIEKPTNDDEIHFSFDIRKKPGNDILLAEGLAKGFDHPLFSDVNLHIRSGDRIALIGPNGAGKSTLFKILIGQLQPDQGHFRLGSGVEIGYYDQQQADLNLQKTAIEEIWDAFPKLNETQIRNALAAFLFRGDEVFQTIDTLSGGERARLALLKLMLHKDNFLLLDEPTNHLDMASREVLEQALLDYPGTILAVSHDRYFVNHIATKVWALEEGGLRETLGNYQDYLAQKAKETQPQPEQAPAVTKTEQQNQRRRERAEREARKKRQAAIREIEREIEEMETELTQLEEEMAQPGAFADGEAAKVLSLRYNALKEKIEHRYLDWEAAQAKDA
ncbi:MULTISPECIES: ABC-F family ATP-binding cassette domain-containing protein [unclassified Clostridium]|uniref:ABC-F family ATP-binding cassette domain-containing protein n=1 Tax=unclassified Clostridium TaxID=2614128 RepID=UPI001106B8CD|nr:MULTISPECIES: ABC-F family ATP-binding cassette domain-containing protein [unclassified Clostridium]